MCGGSKPGVEKMLEFGRELFLLSLQLRQELGKNEINKKMLQVCLSCNTNKLLHVLPTKNSSNKRYTFNS